MGAFSDDTPRLLWLCTIVACIVLAANSRQVFADSKTDADLVFDSLKPTNLREHDHHPRIERDLSSEEDELEFNEEYSPSVEEEHWLSSTVNRLKRSISSFFNKNEEHSRRANVHHKPTVSENHTKKNNEVRKKPLTQSRRKHRQAQIAGQEDYEEEPDEDADEDEYANEYNNEGSPKQGQVEVGTWSDDEDDLAIHSGVSSGEPPEAPTTPTQVLVYGHPRVYRFTFTVLEPYVSEFNDRNSNAFQNLASRVARSIEALYERVPGNQQATVISIQQSDGDPFKIKVTVDVDSDGYYDREVIRRTIYDQIETSHRIENLTVTPENFYFKEFEATQPKCEQHELQCQNGQCVPSDARCNGIRECSDNTDEEGCVLVPVPTSTEPVIPVEPDLPDLTPIETEAPVTIPEVYLPPPTTTISSIQTEIPLEGSGECRADDVVTCSDGSRSICADQECDGIKDCDDGGDERDCPGAHECAVGEFICDLSRCIPVQQRCNGVQDCTDGTDEHNCRPECTTEEFECDNKCIRREQVCDRVQDCQDGRDESNCITEPQRCEPGEFACGDGQCIPEYLRCDRSPHCRNGNDEVNCTRACLPHEWKCNDGTCIDQIYRCNMLPNCPDRSDEIGCNHCMHDQFRCSDGTCLNLSKRCDGVPDCSHSEDEESCAFCKQDEFTCTNGQCIDAEDRCNNVFDCSDHSDERDCNACREDELDCGDECISISFRCDGYTDCKDGRDEKGCAVACSPNEFECVSDRQCIPEIQKCDGNSDCTDGSDEDDCPTRCSSNQLSCNDGSCIELYQQCNGQRDCPDGSDEAGCPCRPDQFQCLDNGQCIDNNLRCDRRNDCSDGSDEYNCPTVIPPTLAPETTRQPISCPSGYQPCNSLTQCIRPDQLCDGRVDCSDLSDETNCPSEGLNLKTYPNSQDIKETTYQYDREVVFQCRDEGPLRARVHWARPNGQPLPEGSADRNGRLEIPNIKIQDSGTYLCVASGYPPSTPGAQVSVNLRVDRWEPPPTPRPPTACGLYEATCSNGQCIPKDKVCDGAFDCSDGSDENRCNPNGCEPNEFQCANKKCVLKTWRCDSDDDCGDGSDEADCGTTPPGSLCQYHQFACHSNNQCIPKSYHCDNERDCVDGSDEIGCSKPVISKPPPPMVTLDVGDTLEITCTAVGVPTPEVVWRLNWGHVPPKCRSTSVNGFGELVCEDIQTEDQGAYSCEAINIKGSVFAVPDTILVVERQTVCRTGYFNDEARRPDECIKCFCFGHTSNCRSADLFIYQFQPPFDTLKLLGVRIDPYTGVVDIRDEPIFRGAAPQLTPVGPNGVLGTLPDYAELSQQNVVPYFALPENYHGNQLKSYGGYLRYTVRHSNRGYPTPGPNIIISGNGYVLLHQSSRSPAPNANENFEVRIFEGEWVRKSEREPETIASREEIMMVLEDIDNILIKLQYNDGILNTTLTNIVMDSAAAPNSGLGAASYVEECSCPVGYTGNSCERCADGYTRQKSGPWLGQCYKSTSCPQGQYYDGRECQICPCPLTNPSNQFGRTCHLSSDREVICDCQPGYVGNRCEYCAPGYTGNPLIPGSSCRAEPPAEICNAQGSTGLDASGRCRCKTSVEGPTCNQCKANTFYLSNKNQFGCIACFCMGITSQCSSSNWYRDQVSNIFTSSINDFALVDSLNRDTAVTDIILNQQQREIAYNRFTSPNVYYWSLPSRYLGNKVTAYGGNLQYTLRHSPLPGGQSSRNSAADVELVSENNINLLFFNTNQTQPSNAPQTFTVPLLEQYWQRHDGQRADREHLLMALADLRAVYIKATYYTNTQESALISVSLDTATDRNTGLERALEVEQCHCPPGYVGLSCENCDVGYTRTPDGIYLGLCELCNCNGHSNDCDGETGICRNCRDYTTGDYCEECLPGYEGDPVNGQPCRYRGPNPGPCNCDPRGSVSGECRNGRCICKVNVEGDSCDQCRPGSFGLNGSNIDGCEFCFCSGVATECTESNLYIEQIPIHITEDSGFTLTDQYHRTRISDKFNVNTYLNEISYNFLPSQRDRLFWSLPSQFTGNKIKSYGGRLEFIQKYTQRPQARYVPDQDVIITGKGVTIYWSNPVELREDIANPVSIPLHPSAQWYRSDQNQGPKPASREDILIVLANIDSILIRATQSSDTGTAYLSDITLDTAVEQNTGKSRATSVEVCRCPSGYRGTSCESCASGYYRDSYFDESRPLGTCSVCPCNNREESCELGPDRRVICHCSPGYTGVDCGETVSETPTPPIPTPPPYPPTINVTIEGPRLGIYQVGSSVRYNCSATSRVAPRTIRIQWTKDGGELPAHAIDDGRGLLVITSLRVSDSGRYVCEVDDGYSVATSSISINVGGVQVPRITVSPVLINVNENELIEIRSSSTGIPAPDLSVQRLDGQPLNPRHYFEDGIFRILQAQSTDSGDYQIIATNEAGSDAARFQIRVQTVPGPIIRVQIQPAFFSGSSGDTVVLRCVATGEIQNFRWSKQGGPPPYNSQEDGGTLTISSATPEDSGVYTCTVVSYSGTRGSGNVTVSIAETEGRWPTASVSPERTTLSQGQSIELYCTATGVPTPSIKWTKLGGELSRNAEQIGSVLHIRNAQVNDRGVYVCVATNVHGLEQASAIVEVTPLEAPRVELYPGNQQTVIQGNSAILQCRAVAGIPTPTIVWSRGDNIPLSTNVEEMSGGTLRFTQVTSREEGDYVCTARNEAGTATAIANIIIYTVPEIQITPAQDVITKNVDESLRLECQATGNPQPNVVWSKYGEEPRGIYLPSGDSIRTAARGQNFAYQEFRRLTKQNEGLYICRAESDAGVVEKRIQLIIDSLPSRGDITERPIGGEDATSTHNRPSFRDNERERFTAPVGTRAEIRCRINNSEGPRIQVNWVRADNSSLPREAYVANGILYIDNVQRSAAGEYRCLGVDSSTGRVIFTLSTYLEVISPPRITLIPPRQVVHPGEHAYINCSATGEQPITISWSPIGRQMPASVYTRDGYIRFNNIQLQDAGRYHCKAVNSAGEADAIAEVIVEASISNPAITAEQKQQIAPTGSTVSLRCRAANPNVPYTVRWIRESLPLPTSSRINNEVLYIYNAQPVDQGRYYCEITTQGGTSSDYIDLQISGPVVNRPPIPPPQPPPTLYITPPETEHFIGDNIDIACQSSEPGAITVWSKLSGWMENNVQNIGGRLRISSLRPENAGLYRCEATGRQGVHSKDYNLIVNDQEVKDEAPIEVKTAPRGSNVLLECKTDLEDPVTYLWTKQGGSLPTYVDIYNERIQLNDVGSIDAGTYMCSASSGTKSIDVPIILVVTGIVPYFTQAPNSYITLPTLGDSYIQFNFEISFKPENGNGLILYNGNRRYDKSGDFISLSLVNGVPEFKYNLGHSTTIVRSDRPVNNKEWHTVKVVRNRKKVTMYVDGEGPYLGTAEGKYIGLDLSEPLYLGGVPDPNNIHPEVFPYNVYEGFVGCISRFKIGHAHQDILRDNLNKTGITICETCSENKCENKGACQEALSKEGYTCICPSGFSGQTCNKLKGEACSPYACGVGRCVETENSFECQCPLGRTGRRCEREITINEPAFQNDAYIAYPTPRPARRLKITMRVKPNDVSDGVLLYCSETEEGDGDFISLAVRDRHLEFRFDAGNGATVIRSESELVPGEWHILTASRSLSDGRLIVDGKTPAVGRLAGNHKTLNLQTPLYIGGYDKHHLKINNGVKVYSGFNGCISEIGVSGLDINIIQNVTDASNVEDCAEEDDVDNNIYSPEYAHENTQKPLYDNRQTGCSSNPCLNRGQCYPLTPIDYQCSCLPGFTGKNCEKTQNLCDHQPCQNQGVCKENSTHYVCDCLLGFTGINCDQRIELRSDAHFDGNGYLEFSRDLLPHQNDEETEIIALEISTNTSDGLIFWHGQQPNEDGQGQDYIALAVVNGYLEYSFDLGMGPAIILNQGKRVDDGERHSVILKRTERKGSIEIDNTWSEEGEADGFTTTLNTAGNIYIGGTPNIQRMTGSRFTQGFNGCIHGFELQNTHRLDLGMKAINGLNVKPCSSYENRFNFWRGDGLLN